MLTFLASAAFVLSATEGSERSVSLLCNARDGSARILRSPAPNDIHPDWAGDTIVGGGQGFRATHRVTDMFGLVYLGGDIYSTRGGKLNGGVFILEREWDCQHRQPPEQVSTKS